MGDNIKRSRISFNRCQHITCNGLQVFGNDYLAPVEELDRSTDFQCSKTNRVMGPDGGLVVLSRCTADRGCYEAL